MVLSIPSHALGSHRSSAQRPAGVEACPSRRIRSTNREEGRAPHALLFAIPLVLVGVIVWVVTSSGTELEQRPESSRTAVTAPVPATPPADLAEVPARIVDTDDRGVAVGSDSSADDRPQLLRFEVVDATGQPATIDVDVEYRIQFSDSPRTLAPERFSSRGPQIERGLPASYVPRSGREVQVSVRSSDLRGDGIVSTSRSTDTTWPRIVLHPTAIFRGLLVDARGSPVEGVPILLRDDTPGKAAHSRVLTDAGGAFAIDAIQGRANRLFVGDPVYPWVPAIEIDAKNGPFVLEPIHVELHAARFRVQRADGSAASGARLDGIGLEGGRFSVVADAEGHTRVTTLLRGRWRINAADAAHGRASRAIEIPLANDEPVLILLPR